MSTYIIASLVFILFIFAVVKVYKDKKKGKCCGCNNEGGCSGCSSHKH